MVRSAFDDCEISIIQPSTINRSGHMGRNRKGRQCGGFSSKMERFVAQAFPDTLFKSIDLLTASNMCTPARRFVLHRRWQQEAAKFTAKSTQARQAQRKLAEQQRREEAKVRAFKRNRPRLDVLAAWTNARLKDDQMERLKLRGATAIASALEQTTASTGQVFSSLQERYCPRYSLAVIWMRLVH